MLRSAIPDRLQATMSYARLRVLPGRWNEPDSGKSLR